MGDNYKITEVHLETMPFKLLIYRLPESELNDKLTYFTRERGLIARDLYNDFLIANCVSNISDFLQYIRQVGTTVEKLNEVREEIVTKILSLNPKLAPINLVINTNQVLKLKENVMQPGEISLTENEHWNKDFYKFKRDQQEQPDQKRLDTSKVQHIKDLPYIKVQKFWRRLGHYITVRQFEPGAELTIVGNRGFTTSTSFKQYIITVCIEEVEDLFLQLERSQISQRVDPSVVINELYELCSKSNPFLDIELYKENIGTEENSDVIDPFENVQQAAQGHPEDILTDALKKKSKTFRDVSREKLMNLAIDMKKKVIGQDAALDDLVDSIQRASVGLKDPEQPIGSFIFTGYTGVGKTYTAKVLAEELVGSRNSLVTVDCSEYSADHEYAKLIGAPSGYIGHEQGGYLTNAIRKSPFSIVLFDEIEKASEKVHQLLLQIMDEGRLTDGKGQKVSFKDAIIVMTSNLGVSETQQVEKTIGFGNASTLTKEKRVRAVTDSLKKQFKPEFLNRVTCMVNFDPLTEGDYMRIIKLELEKLKKHFKLNRTPYSKLSIKFDKSLYSHIYKVGIDSKYGARPLQRAIEKEVSTPLARKILQSDFDCANTKVTISAKKGKVHIASACTTNEKRVDDPPFYMIVNGDDGEQAS